jgi:hypothetical protein
MPVFSGSRNFELLSDEEKQFALHTTVQYAPRAYEWIKDCKATADGLGIASVGREKAESSLPPFEREKVHSFPVSHNRIGRKWESLTDNLADGLAHPRDPLAKSADRRLLRASPAHKTSCHGRSEHDFGPCRGQEDLPEFTATGILAFHRVRTPVDRGGSRHLP